MTIAFVVLDADLGGHTHTATTVAQALARRGHRISFIVGEESRSTLIDALPFACDRVAEGWLGDYPGLSAAISRLVAEEGLEVVHTFSRLGLPELLVACRRHRLPLAWTICGGVAPSRVGVPVLSSIVSLSHEVKDQLARHERTRRQEVSVIPARIATDEVLRKIGRPTEPEHAEFRERHGIPPGARLVFRVARVHEEYFDSIMDGANAVATLRERGLDVRFVHIGFVQVPRLMTKLREHFAALNERCGETVATTTEAEALRALHFLGMADAVIGTGRTAFEAMLAAKPTLVVGKRGFAGVVGPDTIEEIAYYNFSGRNVRGPVRPAERVAHLADALEHVLSHPEHARRIGEFGRDYVLANLDAATAGHEYEELYRRLLAGARDGVGNGGDVRRLKLIRISRRILSRLLPPGVRREIRARLLPQRG